MMRKHLRKLAGVLLALVMAVSLLFAAVWYGFYREGLRSEIWHKGNVAVLGFFQPFFKECSKKLPWCSLCAYKMRFLRLFQSVISHDMTKMIGEFRTNP